MYPGMFNVGCNIFFARELIPTFKKTVVPPKKGKISIPNFSSHFRRLREGRR